MHARETFGGVQITGTKVSSCVHLLARCRWPATAVSPPLFGQRDNIVKLFVVPVDERDSRSTRVNSISETIRFILPRVRNVQCHPVSFSVSVRLLSADVHRVHTRRRRVWGLHACGFRPRGSWTLNEAVQTDGIQGNIYSSILLRAN